MRCLGVRSLITKSYEKTHACDLPAPGYVSIELSPGKYDVRLYGLNGANTTTMEGSANDVEIAEGMKVQLTGSDSLVLKPRS